MEGLQTNEREEEQLFSSEQVQQAIAHPFLFSELVHAVAGRLEDGDTPQIKHAKLAEMIRARDQLLILTGRQASSDDTENTTSQATFHQVNQGEMSYNEVNV